MADLPEGVAGDTVTPVEGGRARGFAAIGLGGRGRSAIVTPTGEKSSG